MEICHKTQFNPTISPFKHKPFNHKTQFLKPYKTSHNNTLQVQTPNKPCALLLINSHSHPNPNPNPNPNPPPKYIKQTTHVAQSYHFTQECHSLTQKLKEGNLSPLQILQDDEDWSETQFWAVIDFLQHSSSFREILEVFNAWTKLEESRVNEFNYNKIIRVLSEAGMMDEATLLLQNMKYSGLQLCSEVYTSIVHGYAQEGKFDDALRYLNEMEETNVDLDSETYDGLIKAYGKFQMYDEMIKCLKRMENRGCLADRVTYNLLIQELSKGKLINRMERMYHTLVSKRMDLQPPTVVAMLEIYADFGVLDEMERFFIKAGKSKAILKKRIVRKIARVYIENHLFSRLDDLANDMAFRMGRGKTDLFWCLRLLSHGCQLSKKGMNAVLQEMEEERVPWNVTVVNIISFVYLKMKNFKQLDLTFSELPRKHVKPDFVTFGILYDGHEAGFKWSRTLKIWRKYGYLENGVEVNTDPLVSAAFGKGNFHRSIEEMSSLLEPKMREEKLWTYETLYDFVLKHHASSP